MAETGAMDHEDRFSGLVIGAAIEVHRHLGPGFLESVYEIALVTELELRKIQVARQVAIPISYKGHLVAESRLDLLIENELVVELKSVESLSAVHTAQVVSYLRAGAFEVGLLINFNVAVLRNGIRRVVLSP